MLDTFSLHFEYLTLVLYNHVGNTTTSTLRSSRIGPDDSPCLKLPDEAWDEPRLLSECPKCQKPLKFNPFVVDNKGRWD